MMIALRVTFALTALLALSPSTALGQIQDCKVLGWTNNGSQPGLAQAVGVTATAPDLPPHCHDEGVFVHVETLIEGSSVLCSGGSTKQGNACHARNRDLAAAEAFSFVVGGNFVARSFHLIEVNGEIAYLGSTQKNLKVPVMKGPKKEEMCLLSGGTWLGTRCDYTNTPIVINTNDQDYRFTSVANGTAFDHDGDGILEQTAWSRAPGQYFLVLDRNGNGQIDSGKEMFGGSTFPGAQDGFLAVAALNALAHFDPSYLTADPSLVDAILSDPEFVMDLIYEDGDAELNQRDSLFPLLQAWWDKNGNGVSERHELHPLGNIVKAVGLASFHSTKKDRWGNQFLFRSWVKLKKDPLRSRDIYDVRFAIAGK